MPDFDMSPYGGFVWSAYGLSALALLALLCGVLWRARRWRRELARREAEAGPR